MQFRTPKSVVEYWLTKEGITQSELIKLMRDSSENYGFSALSVAEESVALGYDEFTEELVSILSPTERALLDFVSAKVKGDLENMRQKLTLATDLSRGKNTRDLVLEGRARMELGLIEFQEGDVESARDSFTWAETRLKSVSRYSLQHDIALLNKAAFHYAVGEDLMALNFYGEVSLEKQHADETKGISRIGAGNILSNRGHTSSAARHYWNAHAIFSKTPLIEMMFESGILFLKLATQHRDVNAEDMHIQIKSAKPMASGEKIPIAKINDQDVHTMIESCTKLIEENNHLFEEQEITDFIELCNIFGEGFEPRFAK